MTTPATTPVPTVWETIEAKEAAIQATVVSHLAAMKADTLTVLKSIASDGAAIPAELANISTGLNSIMPELQKFGSDFFVLLQLITQVTALKAVPVATTA